MKDGFAQYIFDDEEKKYLKIEFVENFSEATNLATLNAIHKKVLINLIATVAKKKIFKLKFKRFISPVVHFDSSFDAFIGKK